MSAPVTAADAGNNGETMAGQPALLDVIESRATQVGSFPVRRTLPGRARRTVGAWCFLDHMGPATVDERGLGVAPFGRVASTLPRVEVGPPPWARP